jgi:hypothetical protein
MKNLEEKNLVWEEFKPQEPPYRLKVKGEDGEYEEIKVHGRVMGKLAIKHVRFYHPGTQTEYIRWNAPESLRLFIADKDPNKIVYVYVKEEEREDNRTGQKKKYFFIWKHAVLTKGGTVRIK